MTSSSPSSSSSPLTSSSLKSLVERTSSFDSDIRFIAMSDLVSSLKSHVGPLDSSMQITLRDTILKLLEDGNSDVTTMSVKCLSVVANKITTDNITFIVDKLGVLISTPFQQRTIQENDEGKKTNNRDIVTDGLQSLLVNIHSESGKLIVTKLIKSLLLGLNINVRNHFQKKEIDVEMSCLSVLKNTLERFGTECQTEHQEIQSALLTLLSHPNDSIRKRVSSTLGPLVLVIDDKLFSSLMDSLIAQMNDSKHPETFIQSISAIARAAGVRVGSYLPQILNKLQSFLHVNSDSDEEEDETKLDLWQNCLQAIESIILRCPSKVTPYVPSLVKLSMELMTYDPLFTYDEEKKEKRGENDMVDEDEDNGGGGGGGWGDDAGGDADGWGDDAANEEVASLVASTTDSTWKVRRAAVCVLSSFIRSRSDLLKEYYNDFCDKLVNRFKERDSAVKEDIFLCCRDLLRESVVADKDGHSQSASSSALPMSTPTSGDAMEDDGGRIVPSFVRTRSSYELLEMKITSIVESAMREFKGADGRTQKAIIAVLTELLMVRPGNMGEFFPLILPHLINSIETVGKGSDVTVEALKLIRLMLDTHKLKDFQSYLVSLSEATNKSIRSGNHKNVGEALGVLSSIAKMSNTQSSAKMATEIFKVTFEQLVLKDVPIDLKLSAIHTISIVLYSFGSLLPPSFCQDVLPVLAERMTNETTCQPTLRAISKISNTPKPNNHNFSFLIGKTEEISSFLRQVSLNLKLDTAKCLISLMKSSGPLFTPKQFSAILSEITHVNAISENELQLSSAILDLVSQILLVIASLSSSSSSPVLDQITKDLLPRALKLACSPLLQGSSLSSLISFFQQFVLTQQKTQGGSHSQLLASLLQLVKPELNKVAFSALAKCIAAITESGSDSNVKETVNRFISEVKSNTSPHTTQIALLYLGEQGKQRDLSSFSSLHSVCVSAFDSPNDDVRMAASFALGNISVGNLPFYLPILTDMIRNRPQHGYLLFNAVKEILINFSATRAAMDSFHPHLTVLSPLMFDQIETKSDSTRDMVSEALGRAVPLDPKNILSHMMDILTNKKSSPLTRASVVAALRYSFTPLMDWNVLSDYLSTVMERVKDESLEVRRQTFLTINALFRSNIDVIPRDILLNTILPSLYAETSVHPELCHEVDYGAFKKIIDDGKPLRKAAFQTLGTLLDVSPHRINLTEYIKYIQAGISDSDDIQLTTYALFSDVGKYHSSAMLEVLDQMPKLLMAQVKNHIAAAKTKDPESALECLRGILRALVVFNNIQGVELCNQYTHFFKQVCATQSLANMLKEIQEQGGR